jgi:ribose transport system permease protein
MTPATMPRRLRRPRWSHRLGQNAGLALAGLLLAACLILYCVIYYLAQRRVPGSFELTTTVNSTMPLVLAGVAQAMVVLTGGIDLSVGGVIDLTNSVAAINLGDSATSMVLCSLAVLLVGALCGLLNGLLIALGRLQPIIVTLATLSIFQGVAIRVLPEPGGQVPAAYTAVLANTRGPVSLIYVLLLVAFWACFRRTALGVGIYAVGNDASAAQANGLAVVRTQITAYVLGGVFGAAAGLFMAATSTAGDATTGNGYTLRSIVAVVLGGVNLFGGRGTPVGAVLGAFVSTMIVNILFFSDIDPLYQSFFEGLFLIIAVLLTGFVSRFMRRVV